MPGYLLEVEVDGADELCAAVDLATGRFPEISFEHCYAEHDGGGVMTIWVCNAPSEAHIERWTAAARLSPVSLRRIDAVAIAGAQRSHNHQQ